MSQPVKLSDSLVLDARLAGAAAERSIAGQVEFWAKLGRAIEPIIRGDQAMALCRKAEAAPISDCLQSADSPEGHQRVAACLQPQPYPHYEAHPEIAGLLIREDADGKRVAGRFVNRKFQPAKADKDA